MRLGGSIIAICGFFALSAHAQTPQLAENTLTVQSEAVSKVSPDQVTLAVTIQEENKDAKIAKQKHDEKLRKILAMAQENGVTKEHIRTGYTSIEPQYDWNNGKQLFRDYMARTNLELTLTDISTLGHMMEEIVNAGAGNIDNVAYGLQNEQAVQEETLVKAMAHAYAKASRIAQAAHVVIEKPLTIEEGASNMPNYPRRPMLMMQSFSMAKKAAMAPAPPELPSSILEIHETVTVTYQIKPQ